MKVCGRDQETLLIVEACRMDRLIVLSHEPGMGAGFLLESCARPALAAEGYISLVWNEWQGSFCTSQLKEAIADAVRKEADPAFFGRTETLDELLVRVFRRTSRRVALLLDNFEDYLRCQTGSDLADIFDAELSHAVAGHSGRFLISLQAHALPALERFSQFIPNLFGCHLQLPPLTPDAAREAGHAEAARRGMELEPAALQALLECTAAKSGGGIHPFFFMRGLTALMDAESRLKSSVVRLPTLELNGGADRLILSSLDYTLHELDVTQTELLFRWCRLLISPARNRVSVTATALLDHAGKLNRFAESALPVLVNIGLLRVVDAAGTQQYEISRDTLTPLLYDWWQRKEAELVARRRAQFRVRSVSVAVAAILMIYISWLLFSR